MPNNNTHQDDDMTLRSLIQKVIVSDNKAPMIFNVYNHDKNKTTAYMLLFGFIHSKAQTKKVVEDDYEFLDKSILDTKVLNYTLLTTNNIQVVLDTTDTSSQDEEENTEENNG